MPVDRVDWYEPKVQRDKGIIVSEVCSPNSLEICMTLGTTLHHEKQLCSLSWISLLFCNNARESFLLNPLYLGWKLTNSYKLHVAYIFAIPLGSISIVFQQEYGLQQEYLGWTLIYILYIMKYTCRMNFTKTINFSCIWTIIMNEA